MTEPKVSPETLTLRAPPRPVTRLNRRTLAIVIGVLAAAVLGATIWSLQSQHKTSRDAPVELHNTERIAHADGLEQLPPDYSKLAPRDAASNYTCATGARQPAPRGPRRRAAARGPASGDLVRDVRSTRLASRRSRRGCSTRRADQPTARSGGGGEGADLFSGQQSQGGGADRFGCAARLARRLPRTVRHSLRPHLSRQLRIRRLHRTCRTRRRVSSSVRRTPRPSARMRSKRRFLRTR